MPCLDFLLNMQTVKLQVSLQREEEEASGEGEEFDPVAHDRREARKR